MRRCLAFCSLLFVILATGACTSRAKPQAAASTSRATSAAQSHPAGSTSASQPAEQGTSVSPTAGPHVCAQEAGYLITITLGTISCPDATRLAAGFDLQGAAAQNQGAYTCELGTATTRPVIFTCSGPTSEFSVQQAVGPQQCPQAHQYQITITSGQLICLDAYATARQFNLQGDAVQQIGDFTCQTGTAATRPTVFTCTGVKGEFAVNQP